MWVDIDTMSIFLTQVPAISISISFTAALLTYSYTNFITSMTSILFLNGCLGLVEMYRGVTTYHTVK